MTFEEMQAILAGVVASQARTEASQAETAAIANSNARAIEAATDQQAYDREQMNQLKELQATTQRQLVEFIRFVGDYGEVTNRRLSALEDR
jgi:hypothetical protein